VVNISSDRSPSGGQGTWPSSEFMREGRFVHDECCYTRENDRCEHWIYFEGLALLAHARDGLTKLARNVAVELRMAGLNVTTMSLHGALSGRSSQIPLYIDGDELDRILNIVANEVATAVEGGGDNGKWS
jgi:hypothetical protein